jgi:ABC-type multidrug transport system ATPase subunit
MINETLLLADAAEKRAAAAPALVLSDVSRAFASQRVLGPIDFTCDQGVLVVVTGPNGAGKTTLLRIAAGLLAPSSGTRMCSGTAVYLQPGAGARLALTVAQTLDYTAALTQCPPSMVRSASEAAGLTSLAGQRVGALSSGQRARLSAALAAVANPTVACLDEPTAHLDAEGVEGVLAVIQLLMLGGATVCVASHHPTHFADLADATLRLTNGQLEVIAS